MMTNLESTFSERHNEMYSCDSNHQKRIMIVRAINQAIVPFNVHNRNQIAMPLLYVYTRFNRDFEEIYPDFIYNKCNVVSQKATDDINKSVLSTTTMYTKYTKDIMKIKHFCADTGIGMTTLSQVLFQLEASRKSPILDNMLPEDNDKVLLFLWDMEYKRPATQTIN